MNLDNKPKINHELTQQIQDCFFTSIDAHDNIVRVVDHERLTGLLLSIINELADRVAYLETQQDADDTIQDYMWQKLAAAKAEIDTIQRRHKRAALLRPKRERKPTPPWIEEWIGEDE